MVEEKSPSLVVVGRVTLRVARQAQWTHSVEALGCGRLGDEK